MLDVGKIFGVVDALGNTQGEYRSNKRRVAVVAYEGFNVADLFAENRIGIHVASGVMAVVFAGIGWARRGHGMEAVSVWSGLSVACGAICWYTRTTVDAMSDEPTAVAQVAKMLDDRAAHLDRVDPGWDARTQARVTG